MSDDDLKAIKERCDAATAGPWHGDCGIVWTGNPIMPTTIVGRLNPFKWAACAMRWMAHHKQCEADLDFIAQSRQDVPALIAEVKRLKALITAPALNESEVKL
ncbi:MAG: hypothetical protein JRL30_00955 [Deltaproteobacteria bacterium]|nr:hypothetical protein [Deltaproteobacteria bacterium]